jgi:peroxiredoxin
MGATVPDFRATTLDGSFFSLEESRRENVAVAVIFISTVCPYSNYFNARMRELATDLRTRGILLVGINSNASETEDEAREHAAKNGHTFPIVKDSKNTILDLLGARRTPEVFVIDHEGRLRYHGRIESKIGTPDLKNALEALIAGRPVRPAETKSFGCAIPRS